MNLKIAILEDKKTDYEQLSSLLSDWAITNGHVLQTTWFQKEKEILSAKSILTYQIIFSDIELKTNKQNDNESNGILICSKLRKMGYNGEIIFLTAFKEYVFNGYDVQAFNYLLKPIQKSILNNCMNKYLSIHFSDFYYLRKQDKIIQIPYNEIICISRYGHDCIIQSINDIHVERTSLKDFEKRLPVQFIRCHKSCIINAYHIKSLSGSRLQLSNHQTQQVGRIYLENIRNTLFELANDTIHF